MKKFTAKIVSFIVVVCVLTMLFPATVFAAGDAGVTKTAYSEYYPNTTSYNVVSGGWAETGYGEVVLNAETPTAKDYAYTKYYGPHYLGAPKGFTWITVSSSDPDVMTATAVTGTDSQGRTCLVVTFQQGTKEGTARIEIDFTVTELRVEAGIASDSQTAYAVSGCLVYNGSNDPGEESSSDSSSEESSSDSSSEESSSSSDSEESSSASGSGSGSQSESRPAYRPDPDRDSSSGNAGSGSASASSSKDIPDTGADSSTGSTIALAGLSAVLVAAVVVVGKKYKK